MKRGRRNKGQRIYDKDLKRVLMVRVSADAFEAFTEIAGYFAMDRSAALRALVERAIADGKIL